MKIIFLKIVQFITILLTSFKFPQICYVKTVIIKFLLLYNNIHHLYNLPVIIFAFYENFYTNRNFYIENCYINIYSFSLNYFKKK